jgi:hypothetical protein
VSRLFFYNCRDRLDQRLTQEGKCQAGHPLEREGKIVSGKKGRTVADGPFAESKEAIGGYFLLQVDDINEAVEIAKQCPDLDYGIDVEVRPAAAVKSRARPGVRAARPASIDQATSA